VQIPLSISGRWSSPAASPQRITIASDSTCVSVNREQKPLGIREACASVEETDTGVGFILQDYSGSARCEYRSDDGPADGVDAVNA
jgi:hypothetical protein